MRKATLKTDLKILKKLLSVYKESRNSYYCIQEGTAENPMRNRSEIIYIGRLRLRHKNGDPTPSWLISKTKMTSALWSIKFSA